MACINMLLSFSDKSKIEAISDSSHEIAARLTSVWLVNESKSGSCRDSNVSQPFVAL